MSNTHVYCFWSCNTGVYGFGHAMFKEIITRTEISEKGGSADGTLFKTSTKTEKTKTLHLVTSRIKER